MADMKFKVGDKVRVKSVDVVCASIHHGCWHPSMDEYCEREGMIVEYDEGDDTFCVDFSDDYWYYTAECLELVGEEKAQETVELTGNPEQFDEVSFFESEFGVWSVPEGWGEGSIFSWFNLVHLIVLVGSLAFFSWFFGII